jgi:hypothetical protein
LSNFADAVLNLPTPDLQRAAAQIKPASNGSSTQTVLDLTETIQDLLDSHLASGRDGAGTASGRSGFSASAEAAHSSLWAQAIGLRGFQGQRNSEDGYTHFAAGGILGVETSLAAEQVLRGGLAASYVTSTVNDAGLTTGSGERVHSYGVTAYLAYEPGRYYLTGQAGYGSHSYDSSRLITATDGLATGQHQGNLYSAKLEGGLRQPLDESWQVSPLLSLATSYLKQNQYGETSAGLADTLTVGSASTSSVKSGLGARSSYVFSKPSEGDYGTSLEGAVIWQHEYVGHASSVSAQFADGTSFSAPDLKPAAETLKLGAALTVASLGLGKIQLRYDGVFRSAYVASSGTLDVLLNF